MKNVKRAVSTIMILCLLFIAACAQKESAGKAETTTAPLTEAATERPYPDIPESGFDGHEFNVMYFDNEKVNTWTGISSDLYIEETEGEILIDSVYERNHKTEELLEIKIRAVLGDDSTISSALKNVVMAGSYDYDVVFPRLYALSGLVNSHMLADLNILPGVDFTDPWWDGNSVKELSVSGKLFTVVSDITFVDKLSTYVIFFNKKMAVEYNTGNLYDTVVKNGWTYDKMLELGSVVSADINGDSKFDQNDVYGISCQNDGAYILLHAAGAVFCEKDENDRPVFTLNQSGTVDILMEIYRLMNDLRQYFNRQTYSMTVNDAAAMFIENRTLFLIRPTQTMLLLRDMEADFGIIPVPKYKEDQKEYGAAINPYTAYSLCVPKVVEDAERTAAVIDLLAAESHYTVIEPFYDVVLDTKLTRDEESAEMLHIIYNSRIYDIGYIWNFADIATGIITGFKEEAASTIAKYENKVIAAIDEFIQTVNQE